MQLLSSPSASFTFDETLPPTPPPILSSLQDPELKLYFERFAYFLYRRAYFTDTSYTPALQPDPLSKAIFDLCVSRLVKLTGAVPNTVNDSYTDGSGNLAASNKRCELRQAPSSTETLPELIVRRFEEMQATSFEEAHDFQLYLYVAINYFFIWFCTEMHTSQVLIPNLAIPVHQLLQPIRDYVARYVRYSWTGLTPRVRDSWFDETWFLRACTLDYPAGGTAAGFGTLADLRQRFASFPWRGNRNRIAATKAMAETLRRALVRFLEIETTAIVARLTGQPSGAGNALVDAYGEFAMYGLGNGSGTKSMFGIPRYGLGFFNYSYGFDKAGSPQVLLARTVSVPLCKEDNDGLVLFYFGLESTPLGQPSILLRPFDREGLPMAARKTITTAGSQQYQFSGGSNVTAEWFGANVGSLAADMTSAPLNDPEEVVFLVFKHQIGERPPPSLLLEAEWTFPDNTFSSADAIGGPPFSATAAQASLKLLVAQVVDAPVADLEAIIVGWGVGEWLNHQPGDLGCDLRRAPAQADTRKPAPGYDKLRYAYGRIYWSVSYRMLWFTAQGFVSPLRCTWDTHLAPTGSLTLQGTFGDFLLPKAQPSYNCVLSAFRAFSLCEAMMQTVMAKAAEMAIDGEIPTAKATALINLLTPYLSQKAQGLIVLPNGEFLKRRSPVEEKVVVTHSIFHSFKVQ